MSRKLHRKIMIAYMHMHRAESQRDRKYWKRKWSRAMELVPDRRRDAQVINMRRDRREP